MLPWSSGSFDFFTTISDRNATLPQIEKIFEINNLPSVIDLIVSIFSERRIFVSSGTVDVIVEHKSPNHRASDREPVSCDEAADRSRGR